MNTLFIVKSLQWGCYVDKNEDGTLSLKSALGEALPEAGATINSCGGIDGFLEKCIETPNDLSTELINRRIARKTSQSITRAQILSREQEKGAKAIREYETLQEQYKDEPIPATFENLRILMAYLCTQN